MKEHICLCTFTSSSENHYTVIKFADETFGQATVRRTYQPPATIIYERIMESGFTELITREYNKIKTEKDTIQIRPLEEVTTDMKSTPFQRFTYIGIPNGVIFSRN